jgi:hypothetical protein
MSKDANDLAAAREAKDKAKILLENIPQVCGIGITQVEHQYAVKVNLDDDLDPAHSIPNEIDGIPVVVHRTGTIRKL